jgi:hypothetical protein
MPAVMSRVSQNPDALEGRRDLLEEFHPFATDAVVETDEPGGVPARSCEAFDEAGTDRVGNNHEYDRDAASSLKCRASCGAARSYDHIRRKRDQLQRASRRPRP